MSRPSTPTNPALRAAAEFSPLPQSGAATPQPAIEPTLATPESPDFRGLGVASAADEAHPIPHLDATEAKNAVGVDRSRSPSPSRADGTDHAVAASGRSTPAAPASDDRPQHVLIEEDGVRAVADPGSPRAASPQVRIIAEAPPAAPQPAVEDARRYYAEDILGVDVEERFFHSNGQVKKNKEEPNILNDIRRIVGERLNAGSLTKKISRTTVADMLRETVETREKGEKHAGTFVKDERFGISTLSRVTEEDLRKTLIGINFNPEQIQRITNTYHPTEIPAQRPSSSPAQPAMGRSTSAVPLLDPSQRAAGRATG